MRRREKVREREREIDKEINGQTCELNNLRSNNFYEIFVSKKTIVIRIYRINSIIIIIVNKITKYNGIDMTIYLLLENECLLSFDKRKLMAKPSVIIDPRLTGSFVSF